MYTIKIDRLMHYFICIIPTGDLDPNPISPDKPVVLTLNVTITHQVIPMSVIFSPVVVVGKFEM